MRIGMHLCVCICTSIRVHVFAYTAIQEGFWVVVTIYKLKRQKCVYSKSRSIVPLLTTIEKRSSQGRNEKNLSIKSTSITFIHVVQIYIVYGRFAYSLKETPRSVILRKMPGRWTKEVIKDPDEDYFGAGQHLPFKDKRNTFSLSNLVISLLGWGWSWRACKIVGVSWKMSCGVFLSLYISSSNLAEVSFAFHRINKVPVKHRGRSASTKPCPLNY